MTELSKFWNFLGRNKSPVNSVGNSVNSVKKNLSLPSWITIPPPCSPCFNILNPALSPILSCVKISADRSDRGNHAPVRPTQGSWKLEVGSWNSGPPPLSNPKSQISNPGRPRPASCLLTPDSPLPAPRSLLPDSSFIPHPSSFSESGPSVPSSPGPSVPSSTNSPLPATTKKLEARSWKLESSLSKEARSLKLGAGSQETGVRRREAHPAGVKKLESGSWNLESRPSPKSAGPDSSFIPHPSSFSESGPSVTSASPLHSSPFTPHSFQSPLDGLILHEGPPPDSLRPEEARSSKLEAGISTRLPSQIPNLKFQIPGVPVLPPVS